MILDNDSCQIIQWIWRIKKKYHGWYNSHLKSKNRLVSSGECLKTFQAHENYAGYLAVDWNKNRLITTSSEENKVRWIWRAVSVYKSGRMLTRTWFTRCWLIQKEYCWPVLTMGCSRSRRAVFVCEDIEGSPVGHYKLFSHVCGSAETFNFEWVNCRKGDYCLEMSIS